jgi:hypothetical protein
MASLVMPSPTRLRAQRWPATPRSVGRFCAWIERHAVVCQNRARQHGAGHHRAGTGQRERAVDGKPETFRGRAHADRAERIEQQIAQEIHAVAGDGGDRKNVGAAKSRAVQQLRDLGFDFRALRFIDQIGLGERDNAAGDAEQIDDGQMLARLRHDAVIGRDHQ